MEADAITSILSPVGQVLILRYVVDHRNSNIMLVIESSKAQDDPSCTDLLPPQAPTVSPTGQGARRGVAQRLQLLR